MTNTEQTQTPQAVQAPTPAFDPTAPYQVAPSALSDFHAAIRNDVETPVPGFDPSASYQSAPAPQTGIVAGVKRNTVDALTGLYHAFSDPATETEKAELLQKIRDQNAKGDKIPETLATNPSRATLALHRIVDAPADVLKKKGQDEVGVAQDLINNHQYWKGGNMYLSGLTDRLLSAVPVAGPMVNAIAQRGESGDVTGAATDVASLAALQYTPAIVKAGGEVAGKVAEAAGDAAGKVPAAVKNTAESIKPEWLTKRPETPAGQHGNPVKIESPLDGPTVGKQLGGKDLSQEALTTLQGHVGDKIPVGGTAKNILMSAVEPVSKAISETASKMNQTVKDAPSFTTSVAQDNVFGEGNLTSDIDKMKSDLPPSVRKALSDDIDAVIQDADAAVNSNDPAQVLEYRRKIGQQIDWDKVEKNPATPAEAQNLARVKVYKALGDKIHAEIPDTVPLDKILQPNLELRSHMTSKLGERVVNDPHAATAEAQSEFKKGQTTVENTAHNGQVAKNWQRIKIALAAAGVTGYGIDKVLQHLVL